MWLGILSTGKDSTEQEKESEHGFPGAARGHGVPLFHLHRIGASILPRYGFEKKIREFVVKAHQASSATG